MVLAALCLTFVALLAGLVALRLRAEARPTDKADTADHLIEQTTSELGHSSIYRVTRDPQAYARIFAKKRK